MERIQIEIGDVFGYWKVLQPKVGRRKVQTLCLCLGCEEVKREVYTDSLKIGKSTSCGCKRQEKNRKTKDENNQLLKAGDTFGFWRVLEKRGNKSLCKCACGVEKEVLNRSLLQGKSKSCGCKRVELDKATKVYAHEEADLKVGDIIHDWKVLKIEGIQITWLCMLCEVESRVIRYCDVESKRRISCGCNGNHIEKDKMFGYWKVIEAGPRPLCLCTGCNVVTRRVQGRRLLNGDTSSCGCKTAHKALQTKEEKDKLLLLSTGERLRDLCRQVGIENHSHAVRLYHQYGEDFIKRYLNEYDGPKIFSTEQAFMEAMRSVLPDIERYDKAPKEFKLNRRPDFRLTYNDKVLYVNIDGLFSHSEKGRRKLNNNYHLELWQNFVQNKQMIFQFREDEVRDSPEIVRSIVSNYLELPPVVKIYARTCVFKKVSGQTANRFFDKNHLMSSFNSATAYGLYLQKKLVACMSVRQTGKGLEIARFASLLNHSIVGGFSKLLKHIVGIYDPTFIQSFCDLRYSTGQSYNQLGFKLESITLGWRWTDGHNSFNRLKCRANMDIRKLTQKEYAKELGWYKIYDAGQAKYVKENING